MIIIKKNRKTIDHIQVDNYDDKMKSHLAQH